MTRYKVLKIVEANSMLEWIKLLKDHDTANDSYLEDKDRGFVDELSRIKLKDFYYYLDQKGTAYTLSINKFCSVPEIGFNKYTGILFFIRKNPEAVANIDKLIKLQAFL